MPEEDHFITSSDGRGYTFYKGDTKGGFFVSLIKLMDGRVFHGLVEDFQTLDSFIRAREEKAAFDYLYVLPDLRRPASEADWRALLSGELSLTPAPGEKQAKPRRPVIVSQVWSKDYSQLEGLKVECSCGEITVIDLKRFNLREIKEDKC